MKVFTDDSTVTVLTARLMRCSCYRYLRKDLICDVRCHIEMKPLRYRLLTHVASIVSQRMNHLVE